MKYDDAKKWRLTFSPNLLCISNSCSPYFSALEFAHFFFIYSFAFYISQISAPSFIDMVDKELYDVIYFFLGHIICLSI